MSDILSNTQEYSVSDLSQAIKRILEEDFSYVRIRGEISGYRGPHSSGHCYFALKDDKAKIDAVIWRGVLGKFKIKPEDGMEVIVVGKVSSFPSSSKYQIIIEQMEAAGIGALMALLEERKRKLAAEGLFEETKKKHLPFLPRVVGIITSPTGAVIRDMLHGFAERFPTHVLLWPVRVQGEGSAEEIAAAIRGFNKIQEKDFLSRPDLLIVARGGGSLEDLWSFNEEVVVRAAADSVIPLISAVGHETDWTLLDLVADARAPTPTKAAEWAVPKYSELLEDISSSVSRLRTGLRRYLDNAHLNLKSSARGLPRSNDLLIIPRQRFDSLDQRFPKALLSNTRSHGLRCAKITGRLNHRLLDNIVRRYQSLLSQNFEEMRHAFFRVSNTYHNRYEGIKGRLRIEVLKNQIYIKRMALQSQGQLLCSLSYQGILERGFAIVRDHAGTMVRRAENLILGQKLEIQFSEGRVSVEVQTAHQSSHKRGGKPKLKPPPKGGTSQGSLL
ncbi:MAG: exodeoxyribonuclease VII large subunit [Hyphomicrobium sp.]